MRRSVALASCALLLASCSSSSKPIKYLPAQTLVASAPEVAAMAATATGSVDFANRETGDVFNSAAPTTVVAHVDVSNDGQRGLLGLAFDKAGNLFAGYTAAGGDQRVTVAQLTPGPTRVLWSGPVSQTLANGGHIAFGADGKLIIGIGDLTDRSKLADPNSPNGKLLALDPNGAANQTPTVVSKDWNNPFAFTVLGNGSVWVGDNEPGNNRERLARADASGPSHIQTIAPHSVASGLTSTSNTSLWECTFLTHSLQRFVIGSSGVPKATGQPIENDCSLGVVTLSDGRLAYSTGTQICVVKPESTN